MDGILQDDEGDLLVQNGDFVTGDISQDIVADTILALPGDYKTYPLFGAGLRKAFNGKPNVFFAGKLRSQLNAQGIQASKVSINDQDGSIQVEL
ncbi:MAG: hypothetical protein JEY96_17015 [Bacteroidales bacterium]|nr:hypothetical protein [Bacteroidales bacterium]